MFPGTLAVFWHRRVSMFKILSELRPETRTELYNIAVEDFEGAVETLMSLYPLATRDEIVDAIEAILAEKG